jgi:hypothetical protein
VHNVSDVRQIEVHTAEPLVPGPSRLEVEIAIAKMKKYKSPGSDQIPAELIQAGGEILLSEIHKLINFVWYKEKLPDQWKEYIIVPKRMIKLTLIIIVGCVTAINFIQNFTEYPPLKVRSVHRLNYWGSPVWVSAFVRYWEKNGSTIRQYISYS